MSNSEFDSWVGKRTHGRRGRRGLVLVMVLWIVVLLGVLVSTAGRSSRLNTKVCVLETKSIQYKWACRAGVNTAIAVLNDDPKASDSLTDHWSDNEEDFNDVMLEHCMFSVRVVDEAGKLNVNTATKAQLLELPEMTAEIAAAIVDWRDKDDTPGKGGAEGGYYRNLPYGYEIRNGFFRTIRELLLVKEVTEELLYGEDTNFNGELDYNEKDGDESAPFDNGDDKLDAGWIDYLTCCSYDKNEDGDGKARININEADEEKLKKDLNIKQSYAKWIVKNREKKKYKSIADLINNQSPQKAKDSRGNSDKAEPLDLETFSEIADKISINNDEHVLGRVNVNTASETVLSALLGGGSSAEQLAKNIIKYREGLADGMKSIGELLKVSGVKVDKFKKIANHVTTRANVFTIHSFATSDTREFSQTGLHTEVLADRGSKECKIVYLYQGAIN